MPVRERTEWHGDEIETRARRAVGRACISWGEQIAGEAKQIVHVQTGALRRSIHAAKTDTIHEDDHVLAEVSDIPSVREWREITSEEMNALVEVGSWLPYACVEECGRHHLYMNPAYELASRTIHITVKTAFEEEGLSHEGMLV